MSRALQLYVAACLILAATARAQGARELKTIATAKETSRSASIGPFRLKTDGVVIRNAEELVALSGNAKSAKDPMVQKKMEAELAKLLKVDAIDWSKQMVLGVIGDGFVSLKTDGKVLMASYVPFKGRETAPLEPSIPGPPKILVLIERFEGEVRFVPIK